MAFGDGGFRGLVQVGEQDPFDACFGEGEGCFLADSGGGLI